MGPADDVAGAAQGSSLWAKYGTRVDSQSAREILAARLETPAPPPAADEAQAPPVPEPHHAEAASAAGGGVEALGGFVKSRQGKQLQREVVRGVFGLLKKQL
jgi:hypothetical protein